MSDFQLKRATRKGPEGIMFPLTKGLFAIIDKSDLPMVAGFKWYAMKTQNTFYAATNAPMAKGVRGKTVLMHRVLCGDPPGLEVDHWDGNGLNNRRENLRQATKSQNAANSRRRDGTSRFRGVTWDRDRERWAAYIRHNGKSKNLGRFDSEQEAAKAYDAAALQVYGEFSKRNFV